MSGFDRFSSPICRAVLHEYPARIAACVAFKSSRYSSTKRVSSLSSALLRRGPWVRVQPAHQIIQQLTPSPKPFPQNRRQIWWQLPALDVWIDSRLVDDLRTLATYRECTTPLRDLARQALYDMVARWSGVLAIIKRQGGDSPVTGYRTGV